MVTRCIPVARTRHLLVVVGILGCTGAPAQQTGRALEFTRILQGPAVTDEASSGSGQWTDVDNDGDLDLFVANGYDVSSRPVPQKDQLYLNDGRGNLSAVENAPIVSDSAYSSGGTWGDYDNDGDTDLFVPTQGPQPDLLYRNDGKGNFARVFDDVIVRTGGPSFAASWVDVDRDGQLDLYVSNGGLGAPSRSFLYRNKGGGTFEPAPDSPITTDSAANVGGSWADYDNDGDQDLYVARMMSKFGVSGALFRNDGDWRFTSVRAGPVVNDSAHGNAGAWGDYDNDGDLDLAVGTRNGYRDRLYRSDGRGNFTRVLEGGPHVLDGNNSFGIHWADYDNDGDLDLLIVNWGSPSFLYTNQGRGRFERLEHGDLGREETQGAASSWGDYDRDGDLDLYIASWPDWPTTRQRNHLYRNNASRRNGWLEVRLVGTRSNRSAIGARILARARIRGETVTQLREIAAHTSFRSQDPLEQHFGLGDAAVVEELTVRWPSGLVQHFRNIRSRQRITITEGNGEVSTSRQ